MKPGTQIAYIPQHANGDLAHPNVEFGFVTFQSQSGNRHWCRYWHRGRPVVMRTTANSELTPDHCLVEHISVPQVIVDGWLEAEKLRQAAFVPGEDLGLMGEE